MDLFSEIEKLKGDDLVEARALLLLLQKVNIPLDTIVKAFNEDEERPDKVIDFLKQQANRSEAAKAYVWTGYDEAEKRIAAEERIAELYAQAETTSLSDILPQATVPQTVADEPVVEDLKEEASDIAPEVVEEALTIPQRLSGIIPSRRQLEQELDSDLIEKATELRKLDKQKAAYDAAFRAGGFAREMAGQAPLQYGFAPAIAPEELSAEDIAAQKTALLRQVSELQRAKARLLGEQQKSGRESGRTQREIYQMLLKMQEERIKTMTDAEEKRYNDLQVRFKEAGKQIDAAREELDLRKNKKAGTVETAVTKYLDNSSGVDRQKVIREAFNTLQADKLAQYLLIKRTAEAYSADTIVNEGGKFKIGPRTFLDENEFVEAALTLGVDDANRDSIRQAFKDFKSQAIKVNELEQDQIEIRKQLDELVWPGVSKFYADKLRTANPWFEQQFVSGSGSGVVQAAPPASDISNASSYVASVAPGAVLAGSQVKMPSGDVVSYDDFVSQFPSAVYDPETQSYGSLAPATRFLEKTIEQVQDEISDLDEPSLSEMEERKQEIMEDPRFGQYMQRFGYTDPEKAFEYFKSDYAARRKISGPTTDRQKRDAAIMSGQALGTLPQRIGAVARTALGPAGRDRRQRRRQAILNILSPGAKKSRITETDARTTVPTEDAPETAPAQAVASPPPAPTEESTLPLVWTEAEGTPYAKYSFDADGNLTMTRYNPETKAYDGETKIIDPDKNKKAYDAITALRSNTEKGKGLVFPEKPASGADAETQTAVGRAVVQEAVEGKQAPTALPRQVPLSKEQLKDELSRIPDAPEDIQISPLERLRFALDERRMRPLKEGSRARAKSEAEGAARRKDVGIKAAEDAISRARMLDEEPPAWALATIDSLPLAPQDRGEIRAEGSEAPGSLVDPAPAPSETPGSPGGSPGVPLGVSARSDEERPNVGYIQQGVTTAKQRTGIPEQGGDAFPSAIAYVGEPEVSSKMPAPDAVDSTTAADPTTKEEERKRKRRLLDRVLEKAYELPSTRGVPTI